MTTYTNTTIYDNPALAAMRALALKAIDSVEWRHHGIGVLQGYAREDCDPEIRLHIWSRELLKPGMDVSGDVHDHRFDMVSHVLCGSVDHEEVIPIEDAGGDHEMLALTHARAAAETNYHGPTRPIDGVFSVTRHRMVIRAGQSYIFPALHFHRSPITGDGVAVTVIEKHQQRDVCARLLYPISHPPVMAFGHEIDPKLVSRVVDLARRGLAG